MPSVKLIVDSGATKAEWALVNNGKPKVITTQGISPYFLSPGDIKKLVLTEVQSKIKEKVSHFACPLFLF